MKHRERVRESWMPVVVWVALSFAASATASAADLLDTANLGERGAILETVGDGFFAIDDARGMGDFDGDGLGDLVLAVSETPLFDAAPQVVHLIRGRPGLSSRHLLDASLPGVATFRLGDPERTGAGRILVAPAGDLVGDELDDFIFSYAEYRRDPGFGQGTAFLVRGAPGLSEGRFVVEDVGNSVPGVVFLSSDGDIGRYGQDHASIGDFNGDGKADLAIGAYSSNTGVVLVFLETRELPPVVDLSTARQTLPVVEIRGPGSGGLGKGIAPAGDFNGDGIEDVLISDKRESFSGTVYLLHGRSDPPPVLDLRELSGGLTVFRAPTADLRMTTAERGQATGVGDVNRDGFDDILLGLSRTQVAAPGEPTRPSAVYLFYGARDFPARIDFDEDLPPGLATVIHPRDSGFVGDSFGISLAAAGDLDSDGVPDFLIGASRVTVRGKSRAGEAYLVLGRRDLGADLFLAPDFDGTRVLGERSSGGLGAVVDLAGDFNGDGAGDLLVAAPYFGLTLPGQTGDRGRAYVLYGAGSGPPPLTVVSLSPPSGSFRGGTEVHLLGSGFRGDPEVLFGDRPAASVRVISESELRAVTPVVGGPAVVDVVVRLDGQTRRLRDAFEYLPDLPEIDLGDPGRRGFRLEGENSRVLGRSIAMGDITGDGVDDLIVGSERDEGWIVTVVHGGSDLTGVLPAFEASPRVSLLTGERRSTVAISVAVLGDINRDGVVDLGIGAGDRVGYILLGRSGLSAELDVDAEVLAGGAVRLEDGRFSPEGDFCFAPMGDFTGDGIDDLAIGFSGADMTEVDPRPGAGEILFLEGREDWPESLDLSLPSSRLARVHGNRSGHSLARALVAAGDVNGDGITDLLATSAPVGDTVRSYLLFTVRDLPVELDVESYVELAGGVLIDRVGRPASSTFLDVAPAGDVNGDGHADLLIGDEAAGASKEGVTFLVPGGPGLPAQLLLEESPAAPDGLSRFVGAVEQGQAGRVGPAGDFNADGFADFLIAGQDSPPSLPGQVSLILGGSDLPETLDLRRPGKFGVRIGGLLEVTRMDASSANTGDLNGDGSPDFAIAEVGSPGAVHVVFGASAASTFIRGDATSEGILNITDAIFMLQFLFLGGPPPICEDAADVDDRGNIDITDPVILLSHLFLGGPSPPLPYPEAGIDPTPDSLECRGF